MDFIFNSTWNLTIFLSFIAYLVGSIPSSVWVGKTFYGLDVRDFGSGNAGATNTFRVLGKPAGTIVLVMDILKGYFAARLAYVVVNQFPDLYDNFDLVNVKLLFGFMAVFGHLLPIFAGFRGGKGVATLAGLIIALNVNVALIALGIFLVTLFVTRFVSVSSMLAGISIPVLFVSVFGRNLHEYRQPTAIVFTIAIAILVVYTHRKNIKRLIDGNETKAKLLPRHRRIDE